MLRPSRYNRCFDTTKWCRIINTYCEELDCPRSLTVWLLFKYGEHQQLVDLDTNPLHYNSSATFRSAYLATEFLSKFDGLSIGDPDVQASLRFTEAEEACRLTNERLLTSPYSTNVDVASVLYASREKISNLLGCLDSTVLEEIFDNCGFGPGVTTTTKGSWLTPFHKMKDVQDCTYGLDYLLRSCLKETDWPSFPSIHNRRVRNSNQVITVPKTAKTSRTIAIEPGLNLFFQKGVGSFIRKRLRRWNVNLNSQFRNQKLAEEAIVQQLATVDLKAASDTISWRLVELLVPKDWFILLCALRSPFYSTKGTELKQYHKFSSMGNGFTFELESMIFSSLCLSVNSVLGSRNQTFSVYGDDIIIPNESLPLLEQVLAHCGFTINRKKTHSSSPFRESCGKHFFNGVECTPFYLKRSKDVVQVITFSNWCFANNFRKTRLVGYKSVPKVFALKGPPVSPGVHFWADQFEMPHSEVLKRRPYGPVIGYLYETLEFQPRSRLFVEGEAAVGSSLYRLEKASTSSGGFESASPFQSSFLTMRGVGTWKRVRKIAENW